MAYRLPAIECMIPVLEAKNIRVEYRVGVPWLHRIVALDDVSLSLCEGTSVGVIGPSGSGKTTLALACAGLLRPSQGQVLHEGLDAYERWTRRATRGPLPVQMVFQNPFAALNPRRTIGAWLAKIFRLRNDQQWNKGQIPEDCLTMVNLPPTVSSAFPGQLSGGECQRACIAACIAAGARALILDEPLSMLDPIASEEVLDRLLTLQRSQGWAYLVVTHDLWVVSKLCQEVLVLSEGRVTEQGTVTTVLEKPQHPVARQLVEAIPWKNAPSMV